MDENQIGPNINTTPVQRYVGVGPYPSGKAVPLQMNVLGSNSNGGNLPDHREGQEHHGKFFVFVFVFVFFLFF